MAEDQVFTSEQKLVDILQLMNKRGEKIIYSSAQVHSGMRISAQLATKLVAQSIEKDNQPNLKTRFNLLEDILQPFNLALKEGPQNAIVIIKKQVKNHRYSIQEQVIDENTGQQRIPLMPS